MKMKNLVFRLMAGTAIILSIISCNNDSGEATPTKPEEKVPVIIHTGVDTRAYETTWQTGDKIGVNMYDPSYTHILDGQFNYEYITDMSANVFHAAEEDQTLFFPVDGSDMRLKSYYPYMSNLPEDMIVHWRVNDQSSLSAIDLMTAEHLTGFNQNATLVHIHFYHRLSKLVFILDTEPGRQTINLSDCQLTIRGMRTGVTYDLFNDVFVGNYEDIADIEVPRHDWEESDVRMAIVLPREAGEGVEFLFTTPSGDVYRGAMSSELELETGNKYIFRITLTGTGIRDVIVDIEPWIDNDFEYIIAN